MKLLFAGTPAFAVPSLEALIKSHHELMAVYTQPDRPAGRGQKITVSPIKQLALACHLPIVQPLTLRDETVQQDIRLLAPDVIVVVAYGLLLPQAVLDIPRLGCVNVHPSLLPRWRGAAPIQRTILAGDKETGVATMQLETGMDTGPILLQEKTSVLSGETSGQLHDRLSQLGAALLVKTIDALEQGSLIATPQSHDGMTHAAKITKAEAQLNWSQSARVLEQQVRGFNPAPIAYTTYHQDTLRIWEAQMLPHVTTHALPGAIVSLSKAGIDVATGDGVLRLLVLQLPGGKPLTAQEFLNKQSKRLENLILGARHEE